MVDQTYEVFAIKYATRPGTRSANFIGGDPHDGPMPMDYFVWLVRNAERTIVVDVGFSEEIAGQRKRTFLRTPREGLPCSASTRRRCRTWSSRTCITTMSARSSISWRRSSISRTPR